MQNLSPGNIGLAGGLFIAGGLLAFMDEGLAINRKTASTLNQIITLGGSKKAFQQDLGKNLILVGLGVVAAQANLMA